MGIIERIRDRRRRGERGAALVEFAILAPLLILLTFGLIEAAWAFSNLLDVRHAVREGARVAAVDTAEPGQIACARMKASVAAGAEVTVSPTNPSFGDDVTVTIEAPHDSLTAFIPFFQNITFNESVTMRFERSNAASYSSSITCSP